MAAGLESTARSTTASKCQDKHARCFQLSFCQIGLAIKSFTYRPWLRLEGPVNAGEITFIILDPIPIKREKPQRTDI